MYLSSALKPAAFIGVSGKMNVIDCAMIPLRFGFRLVCCREPGVKMFCLLSGFLRVYVDEG